MVKKQEKTVIGNNEIHIWWADLKKYELIYQHFEKTILSSQEIEKANSFKFNSHKLDFIMSHGYLRMLLGRYIDCDPAILEYEVKEKGKPFLKKHSNQQKVYFNISHSQGIALYAITFNAEVGVDIENINKENKILELIEYILTPKEIKFFENIDENKKHKAFYNIWTCKEAILKATGEGLNFPLNKLEVITYSGKFLKRVCIRENKKRISQWSLYPLDLIPDYSAAVSTSQKENILVYKGSMNDNINIFFDLERKATSAI